MANPSIKVGDTFKSKQGSTFTVTKYVSNTEVHFTSSSGYKGKGKAGHLRNKQKKDPVQFCKNMIGKTYPLLCGSEATIVGYRSNKDVDIITSSGYQTNVYLGNLTKGKVSDLLHPSVCGVGYLGVNHICIRVNGKLSKEYSLWADMIFRCYDPQSLNTINPSYRNVTVEKDWHSYKNFTEWLSKQNYIEGYELDKDLNNLTENKSYSPKNCTLVPSIINGLFAISTKPLKLSDLPLGTQKSGSRYMGRTTDKNDRIVTKTSDLLAPVVEFYWYTKEERVRHIAKNHPEFEMLLLDYFSYFKSKHYPY